MRTIAFASKKFDSDLAAFCRGAAVPREISASVASILAGVRVRGDAALVRYARKFDGARLRPARFRVTAREVARAVEALPASSRKALRAVRAAVEGYSPGLVGEERARRAGWGEV